MASAYVGKYGQALRRLAAIEAGMTGQPVGPQGPEPMTGAFQLQSGLDPRDDPRPMGPGALEQGGQGPQQMPPGAIEQSAAAGPTEAPPTKKKPVSVRQIVEDMSPKERNEMARGIKERTGKSVDDMYAEMVRSGDIAPPIKRKPNRKEKLPALAEALLRFAQNVGGGMNPGAASASATLDTQGRRGALEQAQIEEDNALAESQRGEVQGVLSARAAREISLADKGSERDWETEKAEQAARNAGNLQTQQDAAALERTKISATGNRSVASQTPARVTTPDGTVMERDPTTGVWSPARAIEEVEERGTRGRKIKTKREGVLKVSPKAETGQVTEAGRQKMMTDAMKAIQEDTLMMARIRAAVGDDPAAIAAEVANRARVQVEEALAGAASLGENYGSDPLD